MLITISLNSPNSLAVSFLFILCVCTSFLIFLLDDTFFSIDYNPSGFCSKGKLIKIPVVWQQSQHLSSFRNLTDWLPCGNKNKLDKYLKEFLTESKTLSGIMSFIQKETSLSIQILQMIKRKHVYFTKEHSYLTNTLARITSSLKRRMLSSYSSWLNRNISG